VLVASLQDRGYIDTPTNAKNVSRPMLVKSLPSFDVLPPVSRPGPKLMSNFSVLTPDKLEKATKVNETDPSLTKDITFAAMSSFEEFRREEIEREGSKSPFLSPARSMAKADNNEEDEDKIWIDDGPDADYDFETTESDHKVNVKLFED